MDADEYARRAQIIAGEQIALDARMNDIIGHARKHHPELFKNLSDFAFAPGAKSALHFSYYIQGREAEYFEPVR